MAAVLALIGAVIVVLLLVLGGGSAYTITAQFENASQLVKGNNVNVAGVPVGSIKEISLADDGQAEVEMEISDESYTPCRRGPTPRSAPSRSRGSPTATSPSSSPPRTPIRRSMTAG